MLREGQAAPGEEMAAGRGRPAVCRRVARSLRLEKRGRGASGVPQMKSDKTKADLARCILRVQDTEPAGEIEAVSWHRISSP